MLASVLFCSSELRCWHSWWFIQLLLCPFFPASRDCLPLQMLKTPNIHSPASLAARSWVWEPAEANGQDWAPVKASLRKQSKWKYFPLLPLLVLWKARAWEVAAILWVWKREGSQGLQPAWEGPEASRIFVMWDNNELYFFSPRNRIFCSWLDASKMVLHVLCIWASVLYLYLISSNETVCREGFIGL